MNTGETQRPYHKQRSSLVVSSHRSDVLNLLTEIQLCRPLLPHASVRSARGAPRAATPFPIFQENLTPTITSRGRPSVLREAPRLPTGAKTAINLDRRNLDGVKINASPGHHAASEHRQDERGSRSREESRAHKTHCTRYTTSSSKQSRESAAQTNPIQREARQSEVTGLASSVWRARRQVSHSLISLRSKLGTATSWDVMLRVLRFASLAENSRQNVEDRCSELTGNNEPFVSVRG